MLSIRPIRTEADYRDALAAVDALWDKAAPGTDAGDHLDVLITLIQAYEREHYPIPPPNPIEAIKFRLEQMGLTRKALEGVIGTRARVAEVLSGARPLSIRMIRRLHRELQIPADILISEIARSTPPKGLARTKAAPTVAKSSKPRRRSAKRPLRVDGRSRGVR